MQTTVDNYLRFLLVVGNGARYRTDDYHAGVELDREFFGIDRLRFSRDEIREYVSKWLKANKRLGGVSESYHGAPPYRQVFRDHLEWLTNSHVGLCAAVIEIMNDVADSVPDLDVSPEAWIRMLLGRVLRTVDGKETTLFLRLVESPLVSTQDSLGERDLRNLELKYCDWNVGSTERTLDPFTSKAS